MQPTFQCIIIENSGKVYAANKKVKSVQLLNLKSDRIGLNGTRANDGLNIKLSVVMCIVCVSVIDFL